MTIPWLSMQRMMDGIVDDTWAEPVELHPWNRGGYAGDSDTPDTTRTVLKGPGVVAVYMTPGSTASGETSDSPIQFMSQDIFWMAIQADILGDPANWREGDRVYWPDRDEWFEVRHVAPSATRRHNVSLARLQEVDEDATP